MIPADCKKRMAAQGAGHGGPAKGPGHGGPATGLYTPFSSTAQPSAQAKLAGKAVAAEIRAAIAAKRDAILEAQMIRALDPSHPHGHAAAVDLLNRIMPPETKATIAGDDDAPPIHRIERIILDRIGG